MIKDFHERVKSLVEQFEGRVVNTAGDSVFGEFDSVVNAVQCAQRIQEEQVACNARRSATERIDTRIGVHLGDVIVEDYHVYGDGVNIAARLEPIADPGGICLSEAVYQQIRNKLDLEVEDIGLRALKNIEHPIRVYKVPPLRPPASDLDASAQQSRSTSTSTASAPASPQASTIPTLDELLVQVPSPQEVETTLRSWLDEMARAGMLIPLVVGVVLLLSPVVLFPTGGVFPTAGAILLGICFGRVWARLSGRPGNLLLGLGFSIATGALWTNWSRFTDSLFLIAGLIVMATGFSGRRRGSERVRESRRHGGDVGDSKLQSGN
ncbi:MAG TPA: adenylate/guanylate cyclase domain-containing protein [Myxococcaceae bacterium]|nr:adenylate/guanylate cyclase domain-containing protein [Myxococcaceae bacterium]